MAYTEIKIRNNKKYFYRVVSVRKGQRIIKNRIYLGSDLSKKELQLKIKEADVKLVKNKELEGMIPSIKKILVKNKIQKAGVFGSFAKGKQKKKSDIDIIIAPPKNIGFGYYGIQDELEQELKRKVDLVSYNGVSPLLKKRIAKEEVRII